MGTSQRERSQLGARPSARGASVSAHVDEAGEVKRRNKRANFSAPGERFLMIRAALLTHSVWIEQQPAARVIFIDVCKRTTGVTMARLDMVPPQARRLRTSRPPPRTAGS